LKGLWRHKAWKWDYQRITLAHSILLCPPATHTHIHTGT